MYRSLQQCRRLSTKKYLIKSKIDENGFFKLIINNPPENVLNREVLTELCLTLEEYEERKISGLILTSECANIFSAGADLNEFHKPNKINLENYLDKIQETWFRIYTSTFPTVAVINGHAYAGGCLLAMACEYRIMSTGFKIGLNEASVGLQLPLWLSNGMMHIINKRQAEIACMTGKLFTDEEAFKVGLVDEIVDGNEALDKAFNYFNLFKDYDTGTRFRNKMSFRQGPADDLKNNWIKYRNQFAASIYSEQVQKKIEQYFNKIKTK